ncbi:MAG TPA: Stp1/IreP family PP2C-type Ser/Thr phosphatase [Bacillales bacterium]|nr:Stp1/IreP family PP2C-type Ser/Thr phosphatase [Bacillales bacterium]
MDTAFITDCGKIRDHNEDSGGVFSHHSGLLLAVVADGMGGHRAGDVASSLVLNYLKEHWEKADGLGSAQAAREWLKQTIDEANEYVLSYALEHPECRGMGTTVVAALCASDFLVIAHVGDSRGYMLGKERFVQVTRDHSLVSELVRQGEISEEEAAIHPRKHVLLKALGTEKKVETETDTFEWKAGDMVLLCSDGLTNNVTDEQMEEVLRSGETMQEKAESLTALANSAGGDDNITLSLVRLTGEDLLANEPSRRTDTVRVPDVEGRQNPRKPSSAEESR